MFRAPSGTDTTWLRTRLRRQVSEIGRLAWPIIVARSGIITMATVDTMMIGHFSSLEMAYLAIGLALVMPIVVTSIGLLMGTLVISANRFGAGQPLACGRAWRRSLPYACCIGLAGFIFTLNGEWGLLLLGQSPELAAHGGEVMRIFGFGLPLYLLFLTSGFFLKGIERPLPGMLVMIAANFLNAGLNWVLIFGQLGAPEMGAAGAAWGTTAARCFLGLAIVAYIWTMRDHAAFGVRLSPSGGWRAWAQQRNIGYGVGVSIGAESTSFGILSLFAGWLGPMALATYTVAFNMLGLIFMVAIGFGAATAVRVGIAHGRHDPADMALAGWTGFAMCSVTMAAFGLVFLSIPIPLATLFSNDPELVAAAAPLIAFTAYLLVVDGGQAQMASALRGRQDVWVPSIVQCVSFFGVMVGGAYILAFTGGLGTAGLLYGVLMGSGVSTLLLMYRFYHLAHRVPKMSLATGD
jgi:MATE family multidrug resistance protein